MTTIEASTPCHLAGKSTTAAWRRDNTINAALGQRVVHISIPRQTTASTLALTAASARSTVVPGWESVAFLVVPVFTAADQLMIRTGSRRTIVLASLFNNKETLVSRLGPDTMSRLGPVSPVFVESHGKATVALADSPGAVVFDSLRVVVLPPTVGTDDSTLAMITSVVSVPEEFVAVSSDVRVAVTKVLLGARVAEPQVLAGFVDKIDGSSGTGDETVSAFGKAPAAVETVSRDTFVLWLEP